MEPLRIGLIGAGIFAREAHTPAWLKQEHARIAAVWSRTPEHAAALAQSIPGAQAEPELDALLARDDIDAVDIVLPIDAQPEIVLRALDAGKHLLSEKPIAEESATARRLIERWKSSDRVWMVAENWRYESAYVQAAQRVRDGAIGDPITATWTLHTGMSPENKYYNTPWRRTGRIPGGFVLDSGVHQVAALRLILGEIESVAAHVRQVRADLPPADTLSATLRFANGALGVYLTSFAAAAGWEQPLQIVGTRGSLRIDHGWIEQSRDGKTERVALGPRDGVLQEIAAFVAAVRDGAPHRNTPEEALRDLAVIEAMLAGGVQRIAP